MYEKQKKSGIAKEEERGLFYEVAEWELEQEDIGRYTTYGIRAVCYAEGTKTVIKEVKDISTKKEFVEKLAEKCNAGGLGIEHFHDVIEDAVAE